MTYLTQRFTSTHEEVMPCIGQIDPRMMANKKRDANVVFEVPNTSAYGRLLNIKRFCSTSKAATLSCSYNISEMTQFDCQRSRFQLRLRDGIECLAL